MKKVFLGGSRHISKLSLQVQKRIKNIIDKHLPVIIGDANGADKAVQNFLYQEGYRNVEVFCSGNTCRNNIGNWQTKLVQTNSNQRDFAFYAAKDRLMASEAEFGLMVWDGKSVGTLLNVWRLLENEKKVAVYISPAKHFVELKNFHQWFEFIAQCDPDVQRRWEKKASDEAQTAQRASQSTLSF